MPHLALWAVLMSVASAACSVDERAVRTQMGEAPDSPPVATSGGASCTSDAQCGLDAPSCTAGSCTCTLPFATLATDPRNCGACGTDCTLLSAEATCDRGLCVLRPGAQPGEIPAMTPGPAQETPAVAQETPAEMPAMGGAPPEPPAQDSTTPDSSIDPCVPAAGAPRAPTSIPELVTLLNALPKPASLPCFLTALERPLTLYLTSSDLSAQPATGARSPRVFLLLEGLQLSVALEGVAAADLLIGYRAQPGRSLKTLVTFPLAGSVSEATVFDSVRSGAGSSSCGVCHVGESAANAAGLPPDVALESDVLLPFDSFEVPVDSLRAEANSCDPAAEPSRCALLSALFAHGEVRQGSFPGL